MKKAVAIMVAIGAFMTLIVVILLMDEPDKCEAPATGGSANVSADGFAEPITDAKNHISSTYKSPERPNHKGIDIAVPDGSPIYAVYDGVVEDAGPATGFGQWIVIGHTIDGQHYSSVYGHMWENGLLVKTGDKVTAGQHIANVGSNGESSGPHLHWEMWNGGRTGGSEVDPTPFLDRVGERSSSEEGAAEQASSSGSIDRLVVIGDSTTVQIQDRLQSSLNQDTDYKTVTIDAIGGTSLYEGDQNGVNRIRSQKSGSRADWFIAMGVNDAANISAGSARSATQRIDDVMALLGDQGTVWWPEVRSGPNPQTPAPDLPAEATRFNTALHSAEGRYDNLKVVSWNPGNDVYTDDIHFNAKGMDERIKMITTTASGGTYSAGAGSSGDVEAPEKYSGAGDVNTEYVNEGQSVSLGIPADVNSLSEVQLDHTRRMIAAGKGRGVDDEVIKAMLMAGLQESGLRMLASRAVPESLNFPNDGVTPGDATSVGFFQIQTPMNMPVADAMDPEKQITWWLDTFESLSSPDKAAWEIAADVERPREDLRGEYRKWESMADELLATQGDIAPSSGGCGSAGSTTGGSGSGDGQAPADLKEFADKAVEAARKYMGTPYVWGGGGWTGPTSGGFDCSGLTMYAYAQGSNGTVKIDHYTTSQMNSELLTDVPKDQVAKGDLVFFNGASDPQHVGLAISNTTMIHAPTTGDVVKEAPISDGGDLVAVRRMKETPK